MRLTGFAREATIAKKPDRRPERTRQALLRALIDLMLERGYESVTVNDVAERANVGRSTLYAHFGGLDGMLKESMTNPSQPLAALVDSSLTPQQLAPLFEHFKDQRKRNRVFFIAAAAEPLGAPAGRADRAAARRRWRDGGAARRLCLWSFVAT